MRGYPTVSFRPVLTSPPSSASPAVTLDTCAQEPIHIPGAIQAHGALLALEDVDLRITQASANVTAYLGAAATDLLGKDLAALFTPADAHRLVTAIRSGRLREASPLHVSDREGRPFDAILHRPSNPGRVILEIEPHDGSEADGAMFDPRLRNAIVRMQAAHDVADLSQIAAEAVRTIAGFDRVMVYRFDAEWNGEVVAEDKRHDLEPFRGLHYPASDIPEQARLLYTRNWLRFIADVGYEPSALVPVLDAESDAPLDLSHAVLRSVSPIHIEYLRNMDVTASMSISLMREGKLFGLIACHHYSGKRCIPYRIRETAEYLGQALSWQLATLEAADLARQMAQTHSVESELVQSILAAPDLLDGLAIASLLQLTRSTGAAVVLSEGTRCAGAVPSAHAIDRIVEWLREGDREVFATDALAAHFPAAAEWGDDAAGVVAVAISAALGEYVLWFRPSQDRVVNWAGDPRKSVVRDDQGSAPPRLSPRGSFALWRETTKGRAEPWDVHQVEAASRLRLLLLGGVRRRAVELRDMNARLQAADRAKDAFVATVSHELRTPLNAITGWTHLLRSGRLPAEQWPRAFEVIARNAQAQTQIVDDLLDVSRMESGKLKLEVGDVDLVSVIEQSVQSIALPLESKDLRVRKILDPDAAQVLGDTVRLRQVVANLLTNAVKFTPKGGSITIVLRRLRSDVEIAITDSGQGIAPEALPRIFQPFWQGDQQMNRRSQGLGLGLTLVRRLVEMHGGRVYVESDGEGRGATFRVQLPLAPVARHRAAAPAADSPSTRATSVLSSLGVLVVEDDADARELLRYVLTEAGAAVTVASDAHEALRFLEQSKFDLLVSDIGLPDMDGLQFVRTLREREGASTRIPAVALTAYTRAVDRTRALQAGFQAHVPKPVDPHELVTVAASLVGRLEAGAA